MLKVTALSRIPWNLDRPPLVHWPTYKQTRYKDRFPLTCRRSIDNKNHVQYTQSWHFERIHEYISLLFESINQLVAKKFLWLSLQYNKISVVYLKNKINEKLQDFLIFYVCYIILYYITIRYICLVINRKV